MALEDIDDVEDTDADVEVNVDADGDEGGTVEETFDASEAVGDEPDGDESAEIDINEMAGGKGKPEFLEVVQLLRQAGLDMPEDLQEADFWKYMCASLRTALSMGAKFAKPDAVDPAEASVKMASSDLAGDPNVSAESPPILMSVAGAKDPFVKQLLVREEKRLKSEYAKTWQRINKLGCPAHIANREMAKSATIQLSVNAASGKIKTPFSLHEARLIEEILKEMGGGAAALLKETLSTATPLKPTEISSHDEATNHKPANLHEAATPDKDEIGDSMRRGMRRVTS